MTDLEAEVAKRVAQAGHLEAQLWAARADCARARRHRGELVGLLVGALADDALSPAYRDLARRTINRIERDRFTTPALPEPAAGGPCRAPRGDDEPPACGADSPDAGAGTGTG